MPRLKFNLEERSRFDKVLAIDKQATLPKVEIQILDGSDPVDLTGATVTFSMQDSNGVAKITGAAATLDDAATGKVSYALQGADVDTDGVFSGQFSVVVAGGTYKLPNASTQRLIIQIGRVELAGLPTADGLVALHAALHILGALDEIDADQLGIDISLPNITPDTAPAEVSSTKHLGAILKGISDTLASVGGPPLAHVLTHIVGGSDPFLTTQLIDAICRRLRTTTGPTDLLLGAIADGEFLKRSGTAIIGGTPAGGGGGALQTPHRSSQFYSPAISILTTGNQNFNTGVLVAIPLEIPNAGSYNSLEIRFGPDILSGTYSGGNLRMGIYDSDSSFLPNNLVHDTGDQALPVGGSFPTTITVVISEAFTANQLIWLAIATSAGISPVQVTAIHGKYDLGSPAGSGSLSVAAALNPSFTYGALPATFGAANFASGLAPHVTIKRA